MASIGLRKPYIAKYTFDGSKVTYTDGKLLAKAIEFSAKVEGADNNVLYADDTIAEADKTFKGGTISITTDDLEQEASAMVLGITQAEFTVGETTVKELVYDDDIKTPYLGLGVIIPKKKDGIIKFRAVVYLRIMFNVPEDSATTQGEKIEWKTPTLEGSVMRSEAVKRPWKRESTFEAEVDAEKYIKTILGISL